MKCKTDERDVCHNINACWDAGICIYKNELESKNKEINQYESGKLEAITRMKLILLTMEKLIMDSILDKCQDPNGCPHRQKCLLDRNCSWLGPDNIEIRPGSPTFYALLKQMEEIHNKKSHDYASNDNPMGNYHFAGKMSQLFINPDDAGFMGRIAEKLYRLANMENDNKTAKNESIEDTELDICTITALWMADRRNRRRETIFKLVKEDMNNAMDNIKRGLDPNSPIKSTD